METLKGKLIVTMRFEIPVNEHMYPLVKREQGSVGIPDIVAAEEENYLAAMDSYMERVGDFISEVDFSFEQTPMRGENG